MGKSKRGKRRPGEKAAADSAPDAGDALCAELHAQPEFHQAVEGKECPASKVEDEAPSPPTERRDQLKLENWEQLPRLLVWFAIGAAADSTARLSFPPSLSKEQRAQIHSAAETLKSIESVSDGAADERFVAVVAKGAAQKRTLSAAQEEEALVLWKLAKEAGFTASRDEVRQHMADGTLSGELATLWNGPKGRSQQEAVQRLSTAASNGDVAEMKEIMSLHPDVVKDGVRDLSNGSATPLHVAAAEGQLSAVKALLEAGADVSAVNARGQTALQVAQAAEECDIEAVLIQAGAKDTKPDGFSTLNASAPVFVPAAFAAAASTSTVAAPATAAPVTAASASSAHTTSSAANGTEQASQQDAPVLDSEPAEQSYQDDVAEDGTTMPEETQHQLQEQEEPVEQQGQGQEEDKVEEATTATQLPVEQPEAEEQEPEAAEQQPKANQLVEAEKPEEAKAEQQESAQQPGKAKLEQQQEPVEQQQQQEPVEQEQEAEQQQGSVEQEEVTEQQQEARQQAEATKPAVAPKQPEGSLPKPMGADKADEEAAQLTQQAVEAATPPAAEAEDGANVTAAAAFAPAPAMPTEGAAAAAAAPDTEPTASTADGSHSAHETAAANAAPASAATVSSPAAKAGPTSPAAKEAVAPKPQQATGSLSRQSSSTVHPLAYAWTPGAATLAQGTTSSKKLFGTIAGGDAPLPAGAAESAPFGSGSSMPAFGSAAAASTLAGIASEMAVDAAADSLQAATAEPLNSFAAAAAAGGVVVQGDTDATDTRLSGITIAGGAAPKEQSASTTILPPPATGSAVDAGETGTLLSVTPPLEDRRPGTSEITPVATANGTAGIRAGPGAADSTDSRAAAEGPGASAANRFTDKEPWYLQPVSAGSSVTWAAAGGVAACVVAGAAALLLLRRRRR